MLNRIKPLIYLFACLVLFISSCKKGTFDINNVNPNVPSDVSPKFILAGALTASAALFRGGSLYAYNQGAPDFAQLYMGYWSVSGDYIPVTSTLTYQTTTSYYSGNWDDGYTLLKNYRQIEQLAATDPNGTNYIAMAKIMEAMHFERLVDEYNNIPFTQALQGGVVDYPKYDSAQTVYTGVLNMLDTAVALINNASGTAEDPGSYDVMFGGNMALWLELANTLTLRTVMNLTAYSGGTSIITSALNGMTSSSFLGAGQDAAINPGYSNNSNAQQSPFYQDMGFQTNASPSGNESYYRACDYSVDFLKATNDTLRLKQIYAYGVAQDTGSNTGLALTIVGRPFGSEVSALQDNQHIAGMGPGLLQTPSSSAVILPACESFFLQAEATLDGFLPGGPAMADTLYTRAVEESFRLLQVDGGAPAAYTAADLFVTSGSDPRVVVGTGNQLSRIILQEWVAMNGFDPVQSWNNWKRLGIPTNLPISIYAGVTASHVPYRLLYSQTEFQFNSANVASQNVGGYPANINDKIFWQP
jgi:Starch-binding associating with outer membrane